MKEEDLLPFINNPKSLSAHFRKLFERRTNLKKTKKRNNITQKQREEILEKSNFSCHICGEKLDIKNFQADHILPHSTGGNCNSENFLASCHFCNNYRWNYLPEEIRWIIKVGVWAKTQVEYETESGKIIAENFVKHELYRESRRNTQRIPMEIDLNQFPLKAKIDYSKFKVYKKPNG